MNILCLLALASSIALSEQGEFPPGYWDRGYGIVQANSYINLNLRVKNIARAEAEIDKRVSRAGGSLKSANASFNGMRGGAEKSKSLSYSVSASKADAIAKSLFDLGDLQNFNHQTQMPSAQLAELRNKVKQIETELKSNEAALKRMPIASFFLNRQLSQLRQSLDSYEASASKAQLNVTVSE